MKKTTTALTIAAAIASLFAMPALSHAAVMYFDTNGATAGSTNSPTQQTWNSAATDWTNDSTGATATVA